jgi:hypothetical protein
MILCSDWFLYLQLTFRSRLVHLPDYWGSTHFWNVGLIQRDYTALYPRKLSPSHLPPWKPTLSHIWIPFTLWLSLTHYTECSISLGHRRIRLFGKIREILNRKKLFQIMSPVSSVRLFYQGRDFRSCIVYTTISEKLGQCCHVGMAET